MTASGIVLRVAEGSDAVALVRVQGACLGAPQWSEGIWRRLLAGEGEVVRVVSVAEWDGVVVGFVVAGCAMGVAEMESVAVLEGARRRGIGRALCAAAMRWAAGGGAEAMELEVRASSEAAMGLYASMGFVEQVRRRGYYRGPVEDAVLMRARLTEASGWSGVDAAKV